MFGSTNTSAFGTPSIFGQSSQQQQPQQTSGVTSFGGWGGAGTSTGFSTTGTNVFGTSSSSAAQPLTFGQINSSNTGGGIFGNQQTATSTTTPTTNFFGGGSTGFNSGTGTTGFFLNSSNDAGTSVRFDAVKDQDTITKNGFASKITVCYQCITVMSHYKDKSLEELRYEDYQLNRHKKSETGAAGQFGVIGTSATTTPPVAPPQPPGGIFSSLFPQQQQQWPSSSIQNTNTTTTGGLFSNLFNQTQKNATNFFGSPSTFGGTSSGTSGSTTTPFNFTGTGTGTTTQQAQGQTTTTSIFGAPQTSAQTTSTATTTPTFTFGQGSTTGTSGTLNLFGTSPQIQQPQQSSGFNFTAAAATVSTTGPGLFGTSSPSTTKPLFGGGTGTNGLGTGTSGTATPSSGFFTGGTQQQQNTTNNNAFGTSGMFGNTATANKTVTFGGTTTTPAPAFGSVALGTSGGSAAGTSTQQQGTAPSTNFGFNFNTATAPVQQRPVTQVQPNISFGTSPMFGTTGSSFKLATAPGTFGSTGGFVLQAPMLQAQKMPIYQHPQYVKPGPVTFGTSAFRDSPLFYNLHENVPPPKPGKRGKRLEMPPADDSVQKYVPKSSSRQLPKNFTSLPLFRRHTSLVKGRNSSISKFKIFDGFEDEDFGVGIDILSPKTDVKRLDLHKLEESLGYIIPLENKSPRVSSSSPSLARRSTEIISEKNSKDINSPSTPKAQQACSSSSVLGNRRVRFLLPPSATKPGQEKDDDESICLGSHFGSSSVSLLETGSCFGNGGGGGGAGDFALLQSSSSDESIIASCTSFTKSSLRKVGSVCGVISSRDGYYVKPSLQQLDNMVDKEGNCFVEEFEIGRRNFGRINFLCPVNVANVNIDELVNFRHKEVVVYPDDSKKPEIGQGLNVPAEIRLERVWPVDKETNELIRGVDTVKEMNYEEKLRRSCKRMGVQFISYDAQDGIWCFRVTHF